MRHIIALLRDTKGASAIEYAMVASLISIAAITAFSNLGGRVDTKYQAVEQKL